MLTLLTTVAIVVVGAYFVIRRVDVRLVLTVCAAALFAMAGQFAQLFVFVAKEMANDKTVVPICSAMGFAYVVKLTGCDRHLITLLLEPLRYVRALLIPGGVAVAFTINTTIVSQSSTAATVGPVMVPLLLAANLSVTTAGSLLLLGASVGGELFNPGAVEIVTLSTLTGQPSTEIVRRVMPANLIASGVAVLVFWWMALARARQKPAASADAAAATEMPVVGDPFRVNFFKAAVPILPLVLLFTIPRFVTLPAELTNSVMIAAAMLAGVTAAGLAARGLVGEIPKAFFEGAGFGYTHVISLIVTATIFTEGIKANGLIEALANALSGQPLAATVASVVLPMALAAATGSGIAPAVAVINVLVPIADLMHLDPVRLGAFSAVAAQLGRTMSPAAAVVMMSAAVSGAQPLDLVRRVVPPLLAGAAALLLAAAVGIV
jgi:DcuC family C4-dicarboxylate transporter